MWAVPFGIVGGRLYHVITTPQPYFGEGGHPMDAFKIWEGGLGIWGAVALGALGAWIGCRRRGVQLPAPSPTRPPRASPWPRRIGRFGNWFNNELYGGPHRPAVGPADPRVGPGRGPRGPATRTGDPVVLGYFQPTFLYESVWCLVVLGRCCSSSAERRSPAHRAGVRALRDAATRSAGSSSRCCAPTTAEPHPRPAAQRLDHRSSCSSGRSTDLLVRRGRRNRVAGRCPPRVDGRHPSTGVPG